MLQLTHLPAVPEWRADPDLFVLEMTGVEVAENAPHPVRFRGEAVERVQRMVEALHFERGPETLAELFMLMGYGGMLQAAWERVAKASTVEFPVVMASELMNAGVAMPMDHSVAVWAYLTSDQATLAGIHRGDYYNELIKGVRRDVEAAIQSFFEHAVVVESQPIH
jgi:hypothetical protein